MENDKCLKMGCDWDRLQVFR